MLLFRPEPRTSCLGYGDLQLEDIHFVPPYVI